MNKLLAGVVCSILGACLVPLGSGKLDLPSDGQFHVTFTFGSASSTVAPATLYAPTPVPEVDTTPTIGHLTSVIDGGGKEVVKFPTLAAVLTDKPLEKSSPVPVVDKTVSDTKPKAEVSEEVPPAPDALGSSPPVVPKANDSTDAKLDRMATQLTVLVSALQRNNLLNKQDADALAVAALSRADGKVEVSESGTVVVNSVVPAKSTVASSAPAAGCRCNCPQCGCEIDCDCNGNVTSYAMPVYSSVSTSGGGSTGSYRTVSSYQTSSGGGSTGSYRTVPSYQTSSGGGSTGNATFSTRYSTPQPQYGNYSTVGSAQSTRTPVTRLGKAIQASRGQTTVSNTVSQSAAPASNCQWFQATDGNWYQVCNQ